MYLVSVIAAEAPIVFALVENTGEVVDKMSESSLEKTNCIGTDSTMVSSADS